VLENVVLDPASRRVDYASAAITENTRASYPIEHIAGARIPCVAGHAKNIVFLCCDAYGVLPPVSRLTHEQARARAGRRALLPRPPRRLRLSLSSTLLNSLRAPPKTFAPHPMQAMFHFISGYTARVAGTEQGVKEPSATFSPCYGGAFLARHPLKARRRRRRRGPRPTLPARSRLPRHRHNAAAASNLANTLPSSSAAVLAKT
jgi:phosphoenolpyruvate carboxykinase (ATP)